MRARGPSVFFAGGVAAMVAGAVVCTGPLPPGRDGWFKIRAWSASLAGNSLFGNLGIWLDDNQIQGNQLATFEVMPTHVDLELRIGGAKIISIRCISTDPTGVGARGALSVTPICYCHEGDCKGDCS